MNEAEIVKLLTPWKECYFALDKATDALTEVGFEPEAPILDSAWKVFDALTENLERQIGDKSEILDWFAHENKMGIKGMKAGPVKGRQRVIKNLKDLVWLLTLPEAQP